MTRLGLALASCTLLCWSLVAQAEEVTVSSAQEQDFAAAIEREIGEFYESYADDLRGHRREEIADRYDPRGVFFLGHGRKTLESFEENKAGYLTGWTGPESFEWKELSIEVLSPDAVVVLGSFDWGTSAGELSTVSYTGLVIKHDGRWRIRVEDESVKCE